MYEDLSNRQLQILNYIKTSLKTKGYPPSVREICKAVGLNSTSTVHSHLNSLEKKGYIKRDPSKPRAIEVIDNNFLNASKMVNVPVVGKVTAGEPILAVENIETIFPLPMELVEHEDVFMLLVRGDSMIEAGIFENDYVLVKKQNSAQNGDIVVALIEDEATIKRFYKEKEYIRLQPENPIYDPIYVKSVTILGKVIGVFRKL